MGCFEHSQMLTTIIQMCESKSLFLITEGRGSDSTALTSLLHLDLTFHQHLLHNTMCCDEIGTNTVQSTGMMEVSGCIRWGCSRGDIQEKRGR